MSTLERLKAERMVTERRMKVVNEAISALESNPEVARIIELVSRAI